MRTRTVLIAAALLLATWIAPAPYAHAQDNLAAVEDKAIAKPEPSSEAQPRTNLRRYVPETISEGWRRVFDALPDPAQTPPMPGPKDIEGWKRVYDAFEQKALKGAEAAITQLHVSVTSKKLGGVPVLEITPEAWVNNGKLLIYTHGGAYTLFSARSTLPSSALVANRTGLRVISVDYTSAPRARWQDVTDQVVTVVPTRERKTG